MAKLQTPFVETNILLSIIEEDTDAARGLLADMADWEVSQLLDAVVEMKRLCTERLYKKSGEGGDDERTRTG